MKYTKENIGQIVRQMERDVNTDFKIGEYVYFNLYKTVNEIQAYINGKHISGSTDSQGYEKAWDDIITEAVNARERATDLDVSNITIMANSLKYVTANEIFKARLQKWFRDNHFGIFLNEWGKKLAEYSSYFLKIVEIKGELVIRLVSWNNIIVDPINYKSAPIIEKLYMTEGDLRSNYSWINDDIIENLVTTKRKLLSDTQVSGSAEDFYEIYEVHTTEETKKGTEYKVYIMSYLTNQNGSTEDFIIYEGKLKKSAFLLTHLEPVTDRTLAQGVVEKLIPKQWIVNHYANITKKTLDFSTKIGFQTSDKSFKGINALDDFDTGDVLITEEGKPITQINTASYNLASVENAKAEQKNSSRSISGVSEAMAGEVKAGSAWRQTEALIQESKDLFNKMQEHKGLYLTVLIKDYIIPHVLEKLKSEKEFTAILEAQSIEKIDKMFITGEATRRANEKAIKKFLENADKELEDMTELENPDVAGEAQKIRAGLQEQGSQRFFKASDISKEDFSKYLTGYVADVIIDITGENVRTQEQLQTLNTTLSTLLGSGIPVNHPTIKYIMAEILRQTTGLSPLQIADLDQPIAQA